MHRLLAVLGCWLVLCANSAAATGPAPIVLDDDPNEFLYVLPHSEVLPDPRAQMTASDVFALTADTFTPLAADALSFNDEAGAYWFRFRLHNSSDKTQRFWLGTEYLVIDYIDVYKRGAEDHPLKSGSKYIHPEWNEPERLPFVLIDLQPGETADYLMRIQSSLRVRFAPKLYADHSFVVQSSKFNIQTGFIYGTLLILFVFTAHLYSSLRDKTFIFFLLYIVALALQTSASQGSVRLFFPGDNTISTVFAVVGSLLNLLAGAFFTRHFLKLPGAHPILDKIVLATGLAPLILVTAFSMSFEDFRTTVVIAGITALLANILISLYRMLQDYRPAAYVLVGNLVMLVPLVAILTFPEIILPKFTATTVLNTAAILRALVLGCGLSALVDNLNRTLSREVAARTSRETQLMQAQQIARYGDWRWDIAHNDFSFSQSAIDILPKLPDVDTKGNDFERLLRRATRRQQHQMRAAFYNAAKTQQGFDTEFSLLHDDGTTHYYFTRAEFQRDARGQVTQVLIGTIHDITDSKLADIAYRENEQRWRELADSTFEAILIYQDGIIVDANQACEQLLGYSPTQLIGTSGEGFVVKDNLKALLGTVRDATNKPIELSLKTRRGENIVVEIRSRSGTFNQQPVQIVALRDVTERLQHEQQLRQLGYYDSLTGLANRTLFQERLQHAIDKSRRYAQNHALLFIDLDQFKHVNDSLGHDIGDQLLIEVGRRLKTRVRKVDTVARLGGDEFAILVEDITAPYIAAKVADEILGVMSEPITVDEYQLMVTPSVGIALYPADGNSGTELLRKADTAMYHAKSLGRNNYQFYTEALNEKMVRRMDLESELRLAIERDEFTLHYQPKVDLGSGDIIGAEALLRWHSRKFGIVPPDEFIAIAEETGLIWPIGELVLRHACEQARHWLEIFPTFGSIAVNISGIQFNHINLVETIADVVRESGMPAHHLELEITEGAIINNAEEAIKVMNRLKELGVRLSLDDFGTGYSSLNYLKRFPVDSLKMDRSFVAEIVNDSTGQKIANNIVILAHDLNLKVVAEGVETEEQLSMIREMGCDELQGYIFSKPLPSEEMSAFIENKNNLYKDRKPPRSASNL